MKDLSVNPVFACGIVALVCVALSLILCSNKKGKFVESKKLNKEHLTAKMPRKQSQACTNKDKVEEQLQRSMYKSHFNLK